MFGGLVFALFIASLIAEDWVWTALGVRPNGSNATLFLWGRVVMVIGIGSVPFTYIVLTRLLAIVDTVRLGDPFVAGNAARLKTMAWALLGLELLHLVVVAVAVGPLSNTQLHLDWSFSVTRWLAVLLLFVLAQVFDDGARMRDDLNGTV
ncbi:MAG TPA: DUF2975 domain-containing protein [Gemmatimonadaceae bacterium]|nr:DUF2975 domain-containing protein [Gemmatimonadaceae bacterium]